MVVVGAGVAADPDGVDEAGFFAALVAAGVEPTPGGRSTKAWRPVDASCEAPTPSASSAQIAVTMRIVQMARRRVCSFRRWLRFC